MAVVSKKIPVYAIQILDAGRNVIENFSSLGSGTGVAVGALPATPVLGQLDTITDGDAALAWGATAVNSGAGATKYLCWWNGAAWKVVGK